MCAQHISCIANMKEVLQEVGGGRKHDEYIAHSEWALWVVSCL
jgi:hypothetical protein